MSSNPEPVVVLDSYSHVLHSDIVGDDYQLSVLPPPSYHGSQDRYPTLYALDGPFTFGLVAPGSLLLTFDGIVPELVVVSIGKPLDSMYEWGPTRGRDYSPLPLPDDESAGHADEFADSLVQEILPFVDDHYRTRPDDRTLSVSHSEESAPPVRMRWPTSGRLGRSRQSWRSTCGCVRRWRPTWPRNTPRSRSVAG